MEVGASGGRVHAYLAVDISTSMRGSKIKQVCESLQDIIGSLPAEVHYEITLFGDKTKIVATGSKDAFNVADLVKKIEGECGLRSGTALYDAWGEILVHIPHSVLQTKQVLLIILTDGEDSTSKRYDLAGVLKLTATKMTRMTSTMRLIQVGKAEGNKLVTGKLQKIMLGSAADVQAIMVDNSATAIKVAMLTVQQDIRNSLGRSAPPRYTDVVPSGPPSGGIQAEEKPKASAENGKLPFKLR